ncbi:MAG: outer membrane beta-barrel protein [Candidatus Acidiferrales bacterium]
MKRRILLCGLMLLPMVASAQEGPKAEIFGGYSYVHMSDSGSANLNGGSASASFNPNSWLGIVGDFGGYQGTKSGLDGSVLTYLFGPKIAFRKGRVTPFVQALFGGAHTSADPPPQSGALVRPRRESAVAGGGQFASSNTFAMAVGGGLDVNATDHIGVRLIQAEYLLTKFKDGIRDRQDSVRLSAGIVFRF